jgi:hypothetical protein
MSRKFHVTAMLVALAAVVVVPAALAKPKPTAAAPPPPPPCTATTAEGSVAGFTYAPKGETHGLRLSDGREVRFPPDQGDEVNAIVDPGSNVRVEGCLHTGPAGDSHIKADRITNLDTGQVWTKPAAPAPPPPRR